MLSRNTTNYFPKPYIYSGTNLELFAFSVIICVSFSKTQMDRIAHFVSMYNFSINNHFRGCQEHPLVPRWTALESNMTLQYLLPSLACQSNSLFFSDSMGNSEIISRADGWLTHQSSLPDAPHPEAHSCTAEETYLASALSSRSVHLSARLWSWVWIFSRSGVSAVAAILSPSARIISTVGRRSSNSLWSSWKRKAQSFDTKHL